MQANRSRDGKRARHDRSVRRAAAEIRSDAEDSITVQGSGVGRGKIVRHENMRLAR